MRLIVGMVAAVIAAVRLWGWWLLRQIMEWEERYDECLVLLRNAQQEIRELRKAKKPGMIRYHCSNHSPYISGDSLAVQLEKSIRRNLYPDDCRFVLSDDLMKGC